MASCASLKGKKKDPYIWQLKTNNLNFSLKWSILSRAAAYQSGKKSAMTCFQEKLQLAIRFRLELGTHASQIVMCSILSIEYSIYLQPTLLSVFGSSGVCGGVRTPLRERLAHIRPLSWLMVLISFVFPPWIINDITYICSIDNECKCQILLLIYPYI